MSLSPVVLLACIRFNQFYAGAAAWLTEDGQTGFDTVADLNYDDKIDNANSNILAANWLTAGTVNSIITTITTGWAVWLLFQMLIV